QARVEDLSIHLKLIHMGKAGFYIRRLAPLSGDVKTDVGILRKNPTADHPVFARPLTKKLLCRVFIHHHAGRKGPFTFIHVLHVLSHSTTCASASITAIGSLLPFLEFATTLLGRRGPYCQEALRLRCYHSDTRDHVSCSR